MPLLCDLPETLTPSPPRYSNGPESNSPTNPMNHCHFGVFPKTCRRFLQTGWRYAGEEQIDLQIERARVVACNVPESRVFHWWFIDVFLVVYWCFTGSLVFFLVLYWCFTKSADCDLCQIQAFCLKTKNERSLENETRLLARLSSLNNKNNKSHLI